MSETLEHYEVGDHPERPQPSTQKLNIRLEQVARLTIERQRLPLERLSLILSQVFPRGG
ncbi:hypothetical protein [Allocoleopsis sp.]|uniref:hypothetical protein n=1 Tax=Allocoleopsis sp. TaxID=3088169 RepID=UPI002FD6D3F0